MSKTLLKKNILGQEEIEAILKLRVDPRNTVRSRTRGKSVFPLDSGATVGRVLIAKLLWLTRECSLKVSHKIFAKILIEDAVRKIIVTGDFQVEDLTPPSISGLTINKIERQFGRDGSGVRTLNILAPRLYNPLTGVAFTPLELQVLQELRSVEDADRFSKGLLQGWDLYPEDLDQLIDDIDRFNSEVDYELFYSDVIPEGYE